MNVLYIIAIEDSNKLTHAKLQRFVNASWVCDLHGCTLQLAADDRYGIGYVEICPPMCAKRD